MENMNDKIMTIYNSVDYINKNIDERIKDAIKESMYIYINKLQGKCLNIGLEAAFQFYYAKILAQILDLKILERSESFNVQLEDNNKIDGRNDYIDAVIYYTKGTVIKKYGIEFKFKKVTDSAPDNGNIESYIDMYTLSQQKTINNFDGAYYIFLTDLQTYYNQPREKGTRAELPMHNGATIFAGQRYNVSGNAAKKKTAAFRDGFVFNKDYKINYETFYLDNRQFWFFIEEI